jgi:hypothetical protein
MLGWRCLMDRVLYVLAEGAACGRGRRVDARRWGGLMVAGGWARLLVLRERGGNQVLNLGIAPRLYGLWPRPLAAWVLNAAGR